MSVDSRLYVSLLFRIGPVVFRSLLVGINNFILPRLSAHFKCPLTLGRQVVNVKFFEVACSGSNFNFGLWDKDSASLSCFSDYVSRVPVRSVYLYWFRRIAFEGVRFYHVSYQALYSFLQQFSRRLAFSGLVFAFQEILKTWHF